MIWLNRLRLLVPVLVLVGMLGLIAYYVLQSPDMLEEIHQRLNGDKPANLKVDVLNYMGDNNSSHQADFYQAANLPVATKGRGVPAVVIVHGGSWAKDDRKQMDQIAKFFAEHDFAVLNIDVRLNGSGGGFPRDICDTKAAVLYLRDNAQRLNVDRQRIFLLGVSSGAHVALMAAYTPDADIFKGDCGQVNAVAAISAPTQLAGVNQDLVVPYLKAGGYETNVATLAKASPITYTATAVPTVLMHGNADGSVPFEQSLRLQAALKKTKTPCELITIDGADHYIMGESKNIGLSKICQFFQRY